MKDAYHHTFKQKQLLSLGYICNIIYAVGNIILYYIILYYIILYYIMLYYIILSSDKKKA